MKKRMFAKGAFIGGLLAGASALLFAPQSGHKTRKFLKRKSYRALHAAKETGFSCGSLAKKSVERIRILLKK